MATLSQTGINLIPARPARAPRNYWCSWTSQCRHPARQPDQSGRDFLSEALLFEPGGWLQQIPLAWRADLLVVLDDGWDVPVGATPQRDRALFGSLVPDPARFPSLAGTPAQRLAALVRRIEALGFAGVGLWVAAQAAGETREQPFDDERQRAYWRERAAWCRQAGIRYWKVDWGVHWNELAFRRRLSGAAHAVYPELLIEHAVVMPALNDWTLKADGPMGSGCFARQRAGADAALAIALTDDSDTFRTYDAIRELRTAITLDRVAVILAGVAGRETACVLNAEDALPLCAGLGLAVGTMRRPGDGFDDVRRVLAWQRLAPPWPVGDAVNISVERLTDTCTFTAPRWWLKHPPCTIEQSAPTVVARGLPLPVVTGAEPPPYVVASRHPNGAVALSVGPRNRSMSPGPGLPTVALSGLSAEHPLGVFGALDGLELRHVAPVPATARLLAQDLLDNDAWDITDHVLRDGARVCLDDALLKRLRSRQASDGWEGGGLLLCWQTHGC